MNIKALTSRLEHLNPRPHISQDRSYVDIEVFIGFVVMASLELRQSLLLQALLKNILIIQQTALPHFCC